MAQLIIAAAGAAIGGAIFGPGALFLGITGAQAGWIIGSAVGSMLGPKQNSQGPRLDDLKVTGTEYGQPIPWICGAPRIAGQLWWASEKRETATTEEVGGKGGGPTVTTYSYDVDVMYGLSDCEIGGITRVWMNGKLVWTILTDSDQQSRIDSELAAIWSRFTVYTGDATQLPDSTYESAVGADLAPGYRGRSYVLIQGLQLGNSGQLPNFTFEVCTAIETSPNISREVAVANTTIQFADIFSNSAGKPAVLSMQPTVRVGVLNSTTVYVFDIDGALTTTTTRTLAEVYPDSAASNDASLTSYPVGILGGKPVRAMNFDVAFNAAPYHLTAGWATGGVVGIGFADILDSVLPQTRFLGQVALCSDGEHALVMTAPTNATVGAVIDRWHLIHYDGTTVTALSEGDITVPVSINHFGFGNSTTYHFGCCMLEDDLQHLWWAYGAGEGNAAMYKIEDDGVLRLRSELKAGAGLQSASFTHPSIWVEAGYCVVFSRQSFQAFARVGASPKRVPLAEAVAAICARAGMSADQYDTTALVAGGKEVRALAAAQSHSGRALLEQLQAAYFFEVALSDKIYFRPRAAAAVATIPFADLAAGNDSAAEQPLPLTLNGDLETPALVAVRYRNAYADQQTGTEYADRITSSQSSLTTLDLALALTPSEAKAIAQSMSADAQAGATSTEIALPMAYARLEPADVVEVVDEDGESTFRLRLVRRIDEAGVLKFEAVVDDAQVVEATGATDNTDNSSTTVRALAVTDFYALDIPILRDSDDAPGFYVAARGASQNWPGSQIFSSANSVDYTLVAKVSESAVLGVCTTTLGDWAGGEVLDEVNSVTVRVAHGELASVTRAALLESATANSILIGNEVVRFVDATLTSADPNTYKLTRLLRGRRGTEWASVGHAASERAVLLRPAGLRLVTQQVVDLQQERQLKAVTSGMLIADVTPVPFTNTGVSRQPFAPVDLRVAPSGAGSAVVSWIRRSRYACRLVGPLGVYCPLGELAESYRVELRDPYDEVVQVSTTSTPSISISTVVQQDFYPFGVGTAAVVSGEVFGVPATPNSLAQLINAKTSVAVTFSTSIARSRAFYLGTNAYVVDDIIGTLDKNLYRVDLTVALAVAAVVPLTTPVGWVAKFAAGAGSLWCVNGGDGNLLQHNATSLAVESSYTYGTSALAVAADNDHVYVAGNFTSGGYGIGAIAAGSPTIVVWHVALAPEPVYEMHAQDGLLFVQNVASVDVRSAADGSLLVTHDDYPPTGSAVYDSQTFISGSGIVVYTVAVGTGAERRNQLRVLDSSTGEIVQDIALPVADGVCVGLIDGDYLVTYKYEENESRFTARYSAGGSLAGYSVTVEQLGADATRGRPATITI